MLTNQDIVKVIEAALAKGHAAFAPVKIDGRPMLARVEDSRGVDFDHVLTVNSLKDVFLPRSEPLAELRLGESGVTPLGDDARPVLVVGTRPCDAAGLAILDAILLGPVRDARYEKRRAGAVIMTLGCRTCDDACFCSSMGYGPHDATGSDVLLVPSGDRYAVTGRSAKGRALLAELGLKEDVGGGDAPPDLTRRIDVGGLKTWLDANFESPAWSEISENCVSCGTCYYLCPTCHCFDITDETSLERGERLRIWDCCSFSDFTKMAGHQPRVGRHARYRQRVMHKFAYCPDNVGKVACVGCGRCVRHCPYGVDICEALERLVSTK